MRDTRVLLVEADSAYAKHVGGLLGQPGATRFHVQHADRLKKALNRLSKQAFDVALLSLDLPDGQGLEALDRVRAEQPGLPIVALVGADDESSAIRALDQGAQDFVVKEQADSALLARSIRYAMERMRSDEEARRRAAQLEALRQVGLELTAQLDLDSLLRSVVSRAMELLGSTAGGLYLYRPDSGVLEWAVGVGPGLPSVGTVLHRGEGPAGKVWETGEPFIVQDYQNWEGRAEIYEGAPWTAVLGVPVRWGTDLLGVLETLADAPRVFYSADAELLSLFATQVAIAIRNARLYHASRLQVHHLAVVNRVARAVSAALHMDHLAEVVYREVSAILDFDAFFIALYDAEAQQLEFRLRIDEGERLTTYRQPLGSGLTASVVTEREAVLIRNYEEERDHMPPIGLRGTARLPLSCLEAPMMTGDRVVGVMSVRAYRPEAFGQEEKLLFSTLSDQVAVAVENARLYEDAQRQRQQAETLRNAALAMTKSLELGDVIERILVQLQQVVPYDSASVQLLRENRLEAVGGQGFASLPDAVGSAFTAGDGSPAWQVVDRRVPVIVHGGLAVPEGGLPAMNNQGAAHSWLGVPMVLGDRVVGIIALDKRWPRFYTEEHARLAEAFAAQAVNAVENARLYEALEQELTERIQAQRALQRRAAQLALINDVGSQIAAVLRLDRVLERAAGLIHRTFGYHHVALFTVDHERSELVMLARAGDFAEMFPLDHRLKLGQGMVGWVAQHGQRLLANDVTQEPQYVNLYPETIPTQSELSVPLRMGNTVVGVLDVQSPQADTFDSDDVMVMETLADQIAVAIENARLYETAKRELAERERAEEQLRHQERLAAVGQLAGGIAHDFNNILTTIMLYTQMLLGKRNLPSEMRPGLETVLDEAQRAARLVQQVLDFSRRSWMETQLIDLRPLVEETTEFLLRTLPENIHLVLEIGPGQYSAEVDPARIRQVIINLALNARDAMPTGGELRIGLGSLDEDAGDGPAGTETPAGEWICIAVTDTGTGIEPDIIPRLFEPFFTTKTAGLGSGLGLAQVHGIVEQHGGFVGVDTELGRGTAFRVCLPARAATPDAQPEATASDTAETSSQLGEERILVVEDEPSLREMAREILQSLGYDVLTASNGREALEVYHSAEWVDLIVTDMVMPGMGGKELVRHLQQENPQIKALAITGYALAEDLEELGRDGIRGIVHKPFDAGTLASTIRRVLDEG
jgi:GAF domain-containing protein/FixJ family two-component response regulator